MQFYFSMLQEKSDLLFVFIRQQFKLKIYCTEIHLETVRAEIKYFFFRFRSLSSVPRQILPQDVFLKISGNEISIYLYCEIIFVYVYLTLCISLA